MKKSILFLMYVGLMVLSTSIALIPLDNFKVSSGHSIAFKSADPSGKFTEINGDVSYESSNFAECSFDLKIPVNTLSTGNGMMNKKAMTEEWFNEASYPYIKFKSSKVIKDGNGMKIIGDLTIKGITKEYTIPASVSGNASKYTFKGTFYVNRIEFKVGKKSESVPDKMKVIYSLPITKK